MKEFVGLSAKTWPYLLDDDDSVSINKLKEKKKRNKKRTYT